MVVMDALWQLANRLLADPVVVIYWFLGAFALGLYGGWRIERPRWETRLTVGDEVLTTTLVIEKDVPGYMGR